MALSGFESDPDCDPGGPQGSNTNFLIFIKYKFEQKEPSNNPADLGYSHRRRVIQRFVMGVMRWQGFPEYFTRGDAAAPALAGESQRFAQAGIAGVARRDSLADLGIGDALTKTDVHDNDHRSDAMGED